MHPNRLPHPRRQPRSRRRIYQYSDDIKRCLEYIYRKINLDWRQTPTNREQSATNMMERVRWEIIKMNLGDALRQMRRVADSHIREARYAHRSVETVQDIFNKFCNFWRNHLRHQDIPNDDTDQWISLWCQFNRLRISLQELNSRQEICETTNEFF